LATVVSKKAQSNFFRRNYPGSRVAQLLKEFKMKLSFLHSYQNRVHRIGQIYRQSALGKSLGNTMAYGPWYRINNSHLPNLFCPAITLLMSNFMLL
jgi:hypothetical protein